MYRGAFYLSWTFVELFNCSIGPEGLTGSSPLAPVGFAKLQALQWYPIYSIMRKFICTPAIRNALADIAL
jgi:hypothetical protein